MIFITRWLQSQTPSKFSRFSWVVDYKYNIEIGFDWIFFHVQKGRKDIFSNKQHHPTFWRIKMELVETLSVVYMNIIYTWLSDYTYYNGFQIYFCLPFHFKMRCLLKIWSWPNKLNQIADGTSLVAQKMKFSIKVFFSKCDQNFIFCAVYPDNDTMKMVRSSGIYESISRNGNYIKLF